MFFVVYGRLEVSKYKRKNAKNVVVVKEGRLNETCCMLFNYDLNGLFLEDRDLAYRDYLKWDSYKYEIADTVLLDKMLEDVQLRYCTKCSELKVIQYIYSSKENKHTFRTYNKFGTEFVTCIVAVRQKVLCKK